MEIGLGRNVVELEGGIVVVSGYIDRCLGYRG